MFDNCTMYMWVIDKSMFIFIVFMLSMYSIWIGCIYSLPTQMEAVSRVPGFLKIKVLSECTVYVKTRYFLAHYSFGLQSEAELKIFDSKVYDRGSNVQDPVRGLCRQPFSSYHD